MREVTVALYNIRSSYNVGSIFRTADGAGVSKIYLCGITPSPLDRFGDYNRKIAKVALGAERSVPWEKAPRAGALIDRLRGDGFVVAAVEQAKNSVPYFRIPRKYRRRKIVLVFGSETKGLPPQIIRKCDFALEIPMRGAVVRQAGHPRHTGRGKESLNVSVSAGIVLFEIARTG
jgi:tRNA G18 (ribose-2'-O)-methylase SpoU